MPKSNSKIGKENTQVKLVCVLSKFSVIKFHDFFLLCIRKLRESIIEVNHPTTIFLHLVYEGMQVVPSIISSVALINHPTSLGLTVSEKRDS